MLEMTMMTLNGHPPDLSRATHECRFMINVSRGKVTLRLHARALCGRRWYGHRLEDEAMTRRESPASSGDGQVTLRIADAVAHVLFDRPWARNAMSWAMYDGLAAACAAINENSCVRVAVLRGAGGKALSPALILRSSASSPMGMMALPTKQGSTALSTR